MLKLTGNFTIFSPYILTANVSTDHVNDAGSSNVFQCAANFVLAIKLSWKCLKQNTAEVRISSQ